MTNDKLLKEVAEAIEHIITMLGAPDDVFNNYHLDDGNLRHLLSKAAQAAMALMQKQMGERNEALKAALQELGSISDELKGIANES